MKSPLTVVVVVLFCLPALAEIPQVIGYQGLVTDNSGNPVADGTYAMRFRIYTAETGGTLLWDSNNQSVTVAGGIFNVLLGESPQPAITLDFDQDYWLLLTFAGEDQTPRKRLGSVGYAYMASGLVPGTDVSGSVTSGTYAAIKGTNTATSGTTYGVYGRSSSTSGRGVYGEATATSGFTYGGRFESSSTEGRGVYAEATATSSVAYGVYGRSSSTSGRGVYGEVGATSGNTYGVYGRCSSTTGTGVYGRANATTGTNFGVFGHTSSGSGYGVYYSGGLSGTGTKACVVKTSKGPTLLYCQESPENWFEDFGEGRMENGRCHIELDPLFVETVTIDPANPMHVFIQPYDQGCVGAAVERQERGFDVVNLTNPSASGAFSYRVVAKRKGFEDRRLDYCAAAETDSYLYPELRERELREHEAERARLEQERRRAREDRAQPHAKPPGDQAE